MHRQISEDGASATEYALLVAGIAAALAIVLFALGTISKGNFDHACDGFNAGGVTNCSK